MDQYVEPDGLADRLPHPLAASSGFTPADYATDLVALLDALDIDHAWLIGHSLGGTIAIWASEQAPQRIKGVTCINAGGGIYLKEEFEKFRNVGQQLIRFRPPWLRNLPFIDLMMNRMNVAKPVDRKWGRQRVIDLVTAEEEAALGSLLDSTTEEEVHQLPCLVSRLKQPVYFIGGEKDDIMEPKYVNHLASFHSSFQFTGENVIEIPECGHLAMVECPDKVAEHIRELLTKHGI
jgi:pimeloyl-ACP methyl ester carboxylesterase